MKLFGFMALLTLANGAESDTSLTLPASPAAASRAWQEQSGILTRVLGKIGPIARSFVPSDKPGGLGGPDRDLYLGIIIGVLGTLVFGIMVGLLGKVLAQVSFRGRRSVRPGPILGPNSHAYMKNFTVAGLKEEASLRGLHVSGTRSDLETKIEAADKRVGPPTRAQMDEAMKEAKRLQVVIPQRCVLNQRCMVHWLEGMRAAADQPAAND